MTDYPYICPTCGSQGYEPSWAEDGRCTFCDGTFSTAPKLETKEKEHSDDRSTNLRDNRPR